MHALRLATGGILVALVATLAAVPASAEAPRTVSPASAADPAAASGRAEDPLARKRGYVPQSGPTFSNPRGGANRPILRKVYRTIRNTAKRQTIRIAVWNFADRRLANGLIDAYRRGVDVKIVTASGTDSYQWRRLKRNFNGKGTRGSFAINCRGACRSSGPIMHMKFFLFSKIRSVPKISMYGSPNLTKAAGERQWNDMITTRSRNLYDYLKKTHKQLRKDQRARPTYRESQRGRFRIWLWPTGSRNPIKEQLQRVRCHGAKGMPGGRTRIRIAIAGWFDAWGHDIARVVRRKWNRGCNIRIVTTLAGGGINRTLKKPGPRGPVPIRQVTIDYNYDGVPDQYMHNKSFSVRGRVWGDRRARLVYTGSPNWSKRASRSDELLIRRANAGNLSRRYDRYISNMYYSPASHQRTQTRASLRAAVQDPEFARGVPGIAKLPEWFELQ